jgi:hypothetical protein
MTEDNRNETPEQDTSYLNFEETIGKTIESIKLNVEAGHYNIDINFTDKTALILDIEPFVTVFSRLGDFKKEELEVIKEYPPITSISLRE